MVEALIEQESEVPFYLSPDNLISLVRKYPTLAEEQQEFLLRELQDQGYEDIAELLKVKALQPNDYDFECPVMQIGLSAPCGVTSCAFWVSHMTAGNCLNVYLKQQNVEALSVNEIAFLHRMDPDEVKETVNSGLSKLRSDSLNVAIDDSEINARFTVVLTDKVCCVCGDPTDEIIQKLQIKSLGLVYCSEECKHMSPPITIKIETKYGLPIDEVLRWTLSSFSRISAAEQALGVNRWKLKTLTQRYLDRTLEEFFPTTARTKKKRNPLVRRTWHKPKWLTKMMTKVRPRIAQIYAKHGPPTIDTGALLGEMRRIIDEL